MTEQGKVKFKTLMDEYDSDISLSTFNLSEQTMIAPTLVCKWIRIHEVYRYELTDMEDQMSLLREREVKVIQNTLKITLSEDKLKKLKLKNDEDINKLQDQISDHRFIISVLSKLEKAISFYRNDIRNAIEYQKMESM